LECDGRAAFVSGVGGVGGAGVKGAAGTDGDWLIGGWSRPKMLAPVGIGGWNWLSAGLNGAGVKGAAGTDGDCAIEAWSRAKTLAPVGIGAWNWLSAGVGSAGVKGAAGTDSDCAIGGTSRPKMLAPVGIGAWNWLSAGTGAAAVTGVTKADGSGETASVVAGETAVAGVGEPVAAEASAAGTDASEAGVGETGTSGGSEIAAAATGNCGGAVEGCAGTLRDECAALEAASATADGSSGDFGSASVGSGEFTDALTAPEFAGRASARTALEFEMENVAARLVAAGGTAEGTAGLPGVPEKTAVTGVTIGAGVATGWGIGGGAVTLARFRVSCCATACSFEAEAARSGVGATAASGAVGDAVGGVAGCVVSGVVGRVVSDPVSNVISEDAAVVIEDVGSESVVPVTVAELAASLASGLVADFKFGIDELGLATELTLRFGAVLGLDLESTFVAAFETSPVPVFSLSTVPNFVSNFVPIFVPTCASNCEPDSAAVSAAAGRLPVCSAAELDIDDASVALKLEDADDGALAAVEAACAATGMGIAFTCIAVPSVRLHSARQ